jgi:GTPase SAR1 family protein
MTYDNVPRWCSKVAEVSNNENLPIVVVGNKCDLEVERKVIREVVKSELPNVGCFDVSAKCPMRYGKYAAPFEYLARKLFGDDKLEFVDELEWCPSDHSHQNQANMTEEEKEKSAKVCEALAAMPLPDDDDSELDDL